MKQEFNTQKIHIAIPQALDDLKACEVDPNYKIKMSKWVAQGAQGVCLVCFAGAVMVRRFNVRPDNFYSDPDEWEFPEPAVNMFRALDWIRIACVNEALWWVYKNKIDSNERYRIRDAIWQKLHMYQNLPDCEFRPMPYDRSPEIWRGNMMIIAEELKKLDL